MTLTLVLLKNVVELLICVDMHEVVINEKDC